MLEEIERNKFEYPIRWGYSMIKVHSRNFQKEAEHARKGIQIYNLGSIWHIGFRLDSVDMIRNDRIRLDYVESNTLFGKLWY